MNHIFFTTFPLSLLLICGTFINAVPGGAPIALPEGRDAASRRAPMALPEGGDDKAWEVAPVFPCPEAADIAPCICYIDGSNRLNMDCSNITSNEELNSVFLGDIPSTEFYRFKIYDNTFITQLQGSCFGNVTFERIEIVNTNINYVSPHALNKSASTLSCIHIHGGTLTHSAFPFNDLDKYTNIDELDLDYQDLAVIPLMSSNTLTILAFDFSSVSSFSQGN